MKMLTVKDVVNLPGTRHIPAGTEVEAVKVLGCPGYFDITAPDGTEISYINGEKYLSKPERRQQNG